MELTIWLSFVATSVLVLIVPGPTILLVISYALGRGKKLAFSVAAGVALGDLIAMSLTLIGLGAIILASATAFIIVKWIGALYLCWMGIRMFQSAQKVSSANDVQSLDNPITQREHWGAFSQALLVTAINPKSIGFFLAFVPQFIAPSRPLAPQLGVMILSFVGLAALNALLWAWAASRMQRFFNTRRARAWLGRASGALLVAMGVGSLAFRRSG